MDDAHRKFGVSEQWYPALGRLPVPRKDVERFVQLQALVPKLRDIEAASRHQHALLSRGVFREALTWLDIYSDERDVVDHWKAVHRRARRARGGPRRGAPRICPAAVAAAAAAGAVPSTPRPPSRGRRACSQREPADAANGRPLRVRPAAERARVEAMCRPAPVGSSPASPPSRSIAAAVPGAVGVVPDLPGDDRPRARLLAARGLAARGLGLLGRRRARPCCRLCGRAGRRRRTAAQIARIAVVGTPARRRHISSASRLDLRLASAVRAGPAPTASARRWTCMFESQFVADLLVYAMLLARRPRHRGGRPRPAARAARGAARDRAGAGAARGAAARDPAALPVQHAQFDRRADPHPAPTTRRSTCCSA